MRSACSALQVLRVGLERRGFEDTDMFDLMADEIRFFLRKQPLTQLTVDQFF